MNTDIIRKNETTTADERKDGSNMTMTVEQMVEAAKKLRDVWQEYCAETTLCERLNYDVLGSRIGGDDTMYSIIRDFDVAYDEYDWCDPDDDKYNDVVINLIKSSAEVAMGSDETCDFVDEFVGMYVDNYASCNANDHDVDYADWYDTDLYMAWIDDNRDGHSEHYPRVEEYIVNDCRHINMDDYRTYCSDDYDGSLPSDIEAKCKTAKDVYDIVVNDLYDDSDLDDIVRDVDDAYRLRDELSGVISEISDNGNNRWWEDVYEQYKSH